ncbi:MAG: hypothetical protein ACFFGZ_11565 [Candidatus Thorarchaeota archaeon]
MSKSKARLKSPSKLEDEETTNLPEIDESHSASKNGRNDVSFEVSGEQNLPAAPGSFTVESSSFLPDSLSELPESDESFPLPCNEFKEGEYELIE